MNDVWTYGGKYICIRKADGEYDRIAETMLGDCPEWDAKAGFLVKAANSHDALVEALRLALPWVSAPLDDRDMSASAVAHRAIRAALETPANPIEEVANVQR